MNGNESFRFYSMVSPCLCIVPIALFPVIQEINLAADLVHAPVERNIC